MLLLRPADYWPGDCPKPRNPADPIMTTDPLRNAIFLVTGSDLIAEQKDRPLAYYLKNHIDRYGGQEQSRCGIVVSDLWYMANEQ
ncbi:MAG: hypothetical protein GWP05_10230, partial [Anaerolineaceae bacterium]|nr:hypothetical protein [Anaerolineaceae bacterium]